MFSVGIKPELISVFQKIHILCNIESRDSRISYFFKKNTLVYINRFSNETTYVKHKM